MVEIGFDLRRLPIHLSMMMANTLIVDYIEAVVCNPNELDVMVERATNLMGCCADPAIVLVVLVAYWQSKCLQQTQPYSLVALRLVAPASSCKISCVCKKKWRENVFVCTRINRLSRDSIPTDCELLPFNAVASDTYTLYIQKTVNCALYAYREMN